MENKYTKILKEVVWTYPNRKLGGQQAVGATASKVVAECNELSLKIEFEFHRSVLMNREHIMLMINRIIQDLEQY